MAFHRHRKLLLDKKYDASSCYLCYVCPQDCYLPPPPLPPPLTQPSKNHHVPTILIFVLSALGAAFLFLSYLSVGKYSSKRTRHPETTLQSADENQGPAPDHPIWYIRTAGLPQSTIDSIPILEYDKSDGLIGVSDCSVCLSEFREEEPLRLLPNCRHAFHVPCIDTWLGSHKNCPVCRAPIPAATESTAGPSPTEDGDGLETEGGSNDENQLADIMILSGKFRVLSYLGDRRLRSSRDLEEPARRSVSMDYSTGFGTVEGGGCSDVRTKIQNSDEKEFRDL